MNDYTTSSVYAQLSDSDVDDSDSSDEECVAPASTRPLFNDASSPPTIKRARIDTMPADASAAVDSGASGNGDSETHDSEGDASDAIVDAKVNGGTLADDLMTRCVNRYVTIITQRMWDRKEKQTWQQMVDEAIDRIQYEIDHRPAVWTHGIGRAKHYLAHMKGLLNVSRVRRVNRDMILEVLLQAREQLEDTWDHA